MVCEGINATKELSSIQRPIANLQKAQRTDYKRLVDKRGIGKKDVITDNFVANWTAIEIVYFCFLLFLKISLQFVYIFIRIY